MLIKTIFKISLFLIFSTTAFGQWFPTGELGIIPVYENCTVAGGRIGVAIFPPLGPRTVYMCQADVNNLNASFPGAGHFIYVHEFGHQALTSANEPGADCWASEALAFTQDGAFYLNAAIRFFNSRGNEYHPAYGTGYQRAERIYNCAVRISSQRTQTRRGITMKNSLPPQMPPLATIVSEGFQNGKPKISEYKIKPGLEYLLEASLSQFISLRGVALEDSGLNLSRKFQGLTKIEGFENCLAYGETIGYPSAGYRCDLNVPESGAEAKFNQLVAGLKTLDLKGWKITPTEEKMFYQISEGTGRRSITLIGNDGNNGQKQISLWVSSPEQKLKGEIDEKASATADCPCPVIEVTGPASIVRPGENMTFTANVTGMDQDNLTYNWSVDMGSITGGQGTSSIRVDTTGLEDTSVTATVAVAGGCPVCESSASEMGVIAGLPKPILMDEFGLIVQEDVNARLHQFYNELQSDPTATGYIILYGTPQITERYERYIKAEIKRVRFDPTRVVLVKGGPAENPLFRFWLVPAGADPSRIY